MGDDYPYKQFDRMIPELFAYFFRIFKVIAVVVVIVLFLAWVGGIILMNVNKKESTYKEPPPLPRMRIPIRKSLRKEWRKVSRLRRSMWRLIGTKYRRRI